MQQQQMCSVTRSTLEDEIVRARALTQHLGFNHLDECIDKAIDLSNVLIRCRYLVRVYTITQHQ